MRILTVGAGVIGTIYGWEAAAAGHGVVHLVRAGRATRYRDGIAMDVLTSVRGTAAAIHRAGPC